jgi:hypothetical protein
MNVKSINISIPNNDSDKFIELKNLNKELEEIRLYQYAEVWICHSEFPALCALINNKLGWLMALRYDGDAGFHSLNLSYQGSKEDKIEYILSNGQMDFYPASFAYPMEIIIDALKVFAETTKFPDTINWKNDSFDSNISPNDKVVNK